jgi:hypothetical protein
MKKTMKTESAACVDAETLAAWLDGTLSTDEAGAVELHISNCARCQAVMAVFAKTAPATPVSVPFWRRWSVGWLVPLTAAAAAVALVIWVVSPTRPQSIPADQLARSEPPPALTPAPPPIPVTPPITATPASPPAAAKAAPAPAPAPAAPVAAQPAPRSLQESVTVSGASPVVEPRSNVAARAADSVVSAAIEIISPAAAAFQDQSTANAARAAGGRGGRGGGLAGGAAAATPPTRWRILPSGSVERSLTGGASWEQIAIYAPGAITAGASPSASVCWLIGRGGIVLLAIDGHVDRVSFPATTDLASVRATDARQATVTTADGRIFSTTDGGASWR